MLLVINGEKQEFEGDDWHVHRLLASLEVQRPDAVVVQVNGEFVGKESYESTLLKANDEVEFLYFMGGGK